MAFLTFVPRQPNHSPCVGDFSWSTLLSFLATSDHFLLKPLGLHAVKPVFSGSALSEHFLKCRHSLPSMTETLTCVEWSPLFGSHGHLFRGPNKLFSIAFTSMKRPLGQDVPHKCNRYNEHHIQWTFHPFFWHKNG